MRAALRRVQYSLHGLARVRARLTPTPRGADRTVTNPGDRSDELNDGFVALMYENWLANPASVGEEWQERFRSTGAPGGSSAPAAAPPTPAAAATKAPPAATPAAAAKPAAEVPEGAALMKGPDGGLVRNMNASLTVPTATTIRVIAMSTIR